MEGRSGEGVRSGDEGYREGGVDRTLVMSIMVQRDASRSASIAERADQSRKQKGVRCLEECTCETHNTTLHAQPKNYVTAKPKLL